MAKESNYDVGVVQSLEPVLWKLQPFKVETPKIGAPAAVFIFLRYDSLKTTISGFSQVAYSAQPSYELMAFCDSIAYDVFNELKLEERCKLSDQQVIVLPLLFKHPADFWKGYGSALHSIPSAGTFYAYLQQDAAVFLLPKTYYGDPKGRLNEASWGIRRSR